MTIFDEPPAFMYDIYRIAFEKIHNVDMSQDQYKHSIVIALDHTRPFDVSPENLLLCY